MKISHLEFCRHFQRFSQTLSMKDEVPVVLQNVEECFEISYFFKL
jgi:hypothetical protein